LVQIFADCCFGASEKLSPEMALTRLPMPASWEPDEFVKKIAQNVAQPMFGKILYAPFSVGKK
jgi:hypothetical protein